MMKRIAVLCDGTWKDPDDVDHGFSAVTNIVKIARALSPKGKDGAPQIAIYDAGVGTGTNPTQLDLTTRPELSWLRGSLSGFQQKLQKWQGAMDRVLGGALGVGLSHNIEDTYLRLVEEWDPGDELFLFGFSRGAYTVRSLAGLIYNCGILRKDQGDRFGEAFRIYKSEASKDAPGGSNAEDFLARYSRRVERIRFIGVFDTVGSLGVPDVVFRKSHLPDSQRQEIERFYSFHDVTLSPIIENAFHALAIDERRDPFKPTLWQLPAGDAKPSRLRQVWFTGVHSDVGGGYADPRLRVAAGDAASALKLQFQRIRSALSATDSTSAAIPPYGLSDITLNWMATRARECGLDLNFAGAGLAIEPRPLARLNDSYRIPYKAVPPYSRPLFAMERTNEAIHASVRVRHDADPAYARENLAPWFAAGKSPAIEAADSDWTDALASAGGAST
jgi:uncharacterized protein (DUF2235 family)